MRKQRHGRGVPALSLMMALMIFSVGGTVFAGAALWPHAAHAAAVAGADGKRPPGGDFANPAVRALDIAQPAMVRVGNFVPASITVGLCTRTVRLPLGGGTYKVGVTGSGAFISANGDVLTADHVVDVSKAD